jgi:hypothetical protein
MMKFAVETANIFMTQESWHVKITHEDSAFYFLQYQGYYSFELIPQGQRVNQAYYMEILKQFHEAVCRKRPEDWILYHDNAPAHKVLSVKHFLAKKNHLLKWNAHPMPQVWLQMTFGRFPK